MKLTKEECEKALENIVSDEHCYELSECALKGKCKYADETVNCNYFKLMLLRQLINEHFDKPLIDIEDFVEASEKYKNEPLRPAVGVYEVSEIRKLEKTLEEVREQGAYYMKECQRLRKQLEENND